MWLGKCDLSSFNKDKYLNVTNEQVIEYICAKYSAIIGIIQKITIMEHPQGQKDPGTSMTKTGDVAKLVYKLNGQVGKIIKNRGMQSPDFSSSDKRPPPLGTPGV